MTNEQQGQAPYSSQQDQQNDDQNPPKLYPMRSIILAYNNENY